MESTMTSRDLFAAVSGDEDAEVLRRLHDRLVGSAATAGFLDVAYRRLETPIGELLLAATDHGLVRVAFAREDHDEVLRELAERISPRILLAPARLDVAAREIDEYLGGARERFDLGLDLRLASDFRRRVLSRLLDLPYGRTTSYTAVAEDIGSPRAVRAVGGACATNPLPVVVPCHRVVRRDGGLGGYVGGIEAKRLLLDLEAGRGGDPRRP
jgi:methylated-DNA-[protein]-cysteine S-methyltransferase